MMNPISELCQFFCSKGKTTFAIKLLDEIESVLIMPEQGITIGRCYQQISEFEKALDVYSKCVEYVLNKKEIYAEMSICHANLLQIEKAEKYLPLCDYDGLQIATENLNRVKREVAFLGSNHGYWQSHDEHIHSEKLANLICQILSKDKKVYDLGCGDGFYLSVLKNHGFDDLVGFEGMPGTQVKFSGIRQQDLTAPFSLPEKGNVICLEVAEHIPREFEQIFLSNVLNACNGYLVFSWAIRGQGGTCHVNCRNNDEVLDMILPYGFTYLKELTMQARNMIEDHCDWFRDTLLIFRNDWEAQNAIHQGNKLCVSET